MAYWPNRAIAATQAGSAMALGNVAKLGFLLFKMVLRFHDGTGFSTNIRYLIK
jgi:hypothetical protein